MIDLHCHILPCLDDGPQHGEEAVEMARLAAADGITDIVATPHTANGLYQIGRERIETAVRPFQDILDRERIDVKIHPGSEVHIHLELLQAVQDGAVALLGETRRYLLLELPTIHLPLFTDHMLMSLLDTGITPIIAHPERNEGLRKSPDRLLKWLHQGIMTQVNGCSLLGRSGKKTQAFAKDLLQGGCVHVLASDGHNAGARPPKLSEAYRYLSQWISGRAVEQLKENARAVLQGTDCSLMEPLTGYPKKKVRWF